MGHCAPCFPQKVHSQGAAAQAEGEGRAGRSSSKPGVSTSFSSPASPFPCKAILPPREDSGGPQEVGSSFIRINHSQVVGAGGEGLSGPEAEAM